MSKYLDFIGQQISKNKTVKGSPNTDLLPVENGGVMKVVKEHGLKVAGGLIAITGGVLAYKHFTKPSDTVQGNVLVDFELTDNLASSSPSNVDVNEEKAEETSNIVPEVEVQEELIVPISAQQEITTTTSTASPMAEDVLGSSNDDVNLKKMASQMGLDAFQGDEMQNFLDSTGEPSVIETKVEVMEDEPEDELLKGPDPFANAFASSSGVSQYVEDQGSVSL